MPRYCPAGDGTFDDWVDSCPDCGRRLQDEPPGQDESQLSDEIVWLISAPNEPEAMLWADSIRATGIPVFVRAGGPGVGAWASVASFEHELLVRERDLIPARQHVRELLDSSGTRGETVRIRHAAPRVNPVVRKR